MSTMKALAITQVNKKAEIVELPRPELDDNSVIVKTLYSGVSVGTEMWVATGQRDDISTRLPYINGYQVSGDVVEVGANVEEAKVGDVVAVFCSGAHAQFVKAHKDYIHQLPDPKIAKIASLFVMPSVGSNGLNAATVNTGDVVLVVGQGLIGQCTAQLARLRGAYVITSEVSPQRLEISRQYCADWAIDATKGSVVEQVKARYPWGVDVVLESTGFQQLLDDAMSCVRAKGLGVGGKFVFLGWYPGTVTYNFMIPHCVRLQAFYPSFIGDKPNREGAIRLMAGGKLEMEPLISHLTPWQQSGELYSRLFTPERNSFNGIVIDWTA